MSISKKSYDPINTIKILKQILQFLLQNKTKTIPVNVMTFPEFFLELFIF